MTRTHGRIEAAAEGGARFMARLGLCVLIAFAVSTLIDGVMRGVFSSPIDAVRDVGELVVAMAVSACFPLAFLEERNIAVSFLGGVLSARGNAWLKLAAAGVVAATVALFAWQFAAYTRQMAAAGETTAMLELPKAPFWAVVDANLWLALAAQLVVLLRRAMEVSWRR